MDTIIYIYRGRNRDVFKIEKTTTDYCLIRLGLPEMLWKEPCHPEMWQELHYLQTALRFLGENPHWTYCVYEDFLDVLRETQDWKCIWKLPIFEDYTEFFWADKVMGKGKWNDWIVLGYEACIPHLLERYIKRMRSIRWYLTEDMLTDPLQSWSDKFYDEYGLAVEFRVVQSRSGLCPSSAIPVNILDCTAENKVLAGDVAKSSIWLDICAKNGKRRRLEARNPQITYFSLKKQWEQSQNAPINLDTIRKNGYNT